MRRTTAVIVLGTLLALAWPQPAAASTRVPLYYADPGIGPRWHVDETVTRWNRNDKIVLTEVPACTPDLNPCVTVVVKWDTTWPGVEPRTIEALWDPGPGDVGRWGHSTIELYRWPKVNSVWRQNTTCHEFGHFIFGDGDHPEYGCIGGGRIYPGRWLRERIPARPLPQVS